MDKKGPGGVVGAELITEELVAEHLSAAWSSLVPNGAPPEEGTAPLEAGPCRCLTATVAITGAWNGLVRLSLAEPAALALAREVFQSEEISPEDLCDAVGELVNIVGGNLKGHLPAPTQLSLPTVAEGTVVVPGRLACGRAHLDRAVVVDLGLAWRQVPLRLTVWEGSAPNPEAPPRSR